jgi:hypothetical protein
MGLCQPIAVTCREQGVPEHYLGHTLTRSITMNKAILKSAALVVALGSVLSLSACNVEKTEEGALPDVDVDANAGKMPAYDVETADVDVGTKPAEVSVPDVDVDVSSKPATVAVPDVDVNMPNENDATEEAPVENNQ